MTRSRNTRMGSLLSKKESENNPCERISNGLLWAPVQGWLNGIIRKWFPFDCNCGDFGRDFEGFSIWWETHRKRTYLCHCSCGFCGIKYKWNSLLLLVSYCVAPPNCNGWMDGWMDGWLRSFEWWMMRTMSFLILEHFPLISLTCNKGMNDKVNPIWQQQPTEPWQEKDDLRQEWSSNFRLQSSVET